MVNTGGMEKVYYLRGKSEEKRWRGCGEMRKEGGRTEKTEKARRRGRQIEPGVKGKSVKKK